MKLKGRCLSMFILIAATSFLFISCGIPEFIDLNGLGINADTSEHSIVVEGSDPSLVKVIDGPGLVLLYSTDSETLSKFPLMCEEFNKRFNSKDATKSSTPLAYDSISGRVGSFSGVDLFAFKKSSDGKFESPFAYCLDINQLIGQKLMITTSGTDLNIENSSHSTLNSLVLPESETNQTIYLFAAFSAQGTINNQFNNVYWSDLVYVGSFEI